LKLLAPKKVDWDLKERVKERLNLLDRRTKIAIVELIRRRLLNEEGNVQNFTQAINAAQHASRLED